MTRRRLRTAALAALAGLLALPAPALGWWNDEWGARKALRIDAGVAEPTGPFPLLVRLHAGNFRFDAAREDGGDLRFVAGDDKTPLKFHLEKYDALLGEAFAWVSIPELNPGKATDIWLYYKNPKAPPQADAKETWDAATALVYHFDERGAPPRDSSASGNHATSAAGAADGALVGRGLRLDGASSVQVPAGPSLTWTAGGKMTWSAWVRPSAVGLTGLILSRRDGAGGLLVGVQEGKPYVEVVGAAGPQRVAAAEGLGGGAWYHLAVTAGDGITLHVNGVAAGRIDAPLPALDVPWYLGAPPATAPPAGGARPAPVPGFQGDLDEVQVATVERPAAFLRASVASQGTDPGKLLVAGQDEESGGGGGYLAILIGSVTVDGWVVIALLAVMLVVSWAVMVTKASYLSAVEGANDRFTEKFRHLSSDLAKLADPEAEGSPLGDEKRLRDSPLFRIFQVGTEEVRKRTGRGASLSAEAIEAVRATLDATLVRENQRLTSRMVLLTIAISGGPFLGLLGTVVGVMITFASIAAAGDVNVNAIAPGIAAALVATVAGLAVAIPALFGYNWLLTRIKDVTATMQVFVDELVTKLAEAHASNGERAWTGQRPMAAGE